MTVHAFPAPLITAVIADARALISTGAETPVVLLDPEEISAGIAELVAQLLRDKYHHRRAHDDQFDLRQTPTGDWRFHHRR
jgi:hypothetical protein